MGLPLQAGRVAENLGWRQPGRGEEGEDVSGVGSVGWMRTWGQEVSMATPLGVQDREPGPGQLVAPEVGRMPVLDLLDPWNLTRGRLGVSSREGSGGSRDQGRRGLRSVVGSGGRGRSPGMHRASGRDQEDAGTN